MMEAVSSVFEYSLCTALDSGEGGAASERAGAGRPCPMRACVCHVIHLCMRRRIWCASDVQEHGSHVRDFTLKASRLKDFLASSSPSPPLNRKCSAEGAAAGCHARRTCISQAGGVPTDGGAAAPTWGCAATSSSRPASFPSTLISDCCSRSLMRYKASTL